MFGQSAYHMFDWIMRVYIYIYTVWWFGTCFIVPSIGNLIIPTYELIFFREVGSTTNQLHVYTCRSNDIPRYIHIFFNVLVYCKSPVLLVKTVNPRIVRLNSDPKIVLVKSRPVLGQTLNKWWSWHDFVAQPHLMVHYIPLMSCWWYLISH